MSATGKRVYKNIVCGYCVRGELLMRLRIFFPPSPRVLERLNIKVSVELNSNEFHVALCSVLCIGIIAIE